MRAVDSVLAQTYKNLEIIVVDDGSEDDTGERIRQRKLMYVKTPNRGVAAARNTGLKLASGRWIAFLDSDDYWVPTKIEKQVDFMLRHPQFRMVHSAERWYRNGIKVNPPKKYAKYGGQVFRYCLPLCMIGPSTVLMERSLLWEFDGFDENYPVCEDYDLWLRITAQYPIGLIAKELTWKYGGHADQLSTSHSALDYWRIRSLCNAIRNASLDENQMTAAVSELQRKAGILLKGYQKHGRVTEYSELLEMVGDASGDIGVLAKSLPRPISNGSI